MPEPRHCEICSIDIPQARLDVLPEATMCVKCAEKHGQKKRVGFMVSVHSKGTAPELITIDPDDAESLRQARRVHNRER